MNYEIEIPKLLNQLAEAIDSGDKGRIIECYDVLEILPVNWNKDVDRNDANRYDKLIGKANDVLYS